MLLYSNGLTQGGHLDLSETKARPEQRQTECAWSIQRHRKLAATTVQFSENFMYNVRGEKERQRQRDREEFDTITRIEIDSITRRLVFSTRWS